MNIEQSIVQGMRSMGIDVPVNAAARLAAYVALLERWNRVYNLTAVRHPQDMVVRHILDSLSILPWLQGPRVLDVGSGAGLPGIPLAIVRPELDFVLLDSNAKRTRFMTQVVTELALANIRVVRSRIDDYQAAPGFDSVLSRAFTSLAEFLSCAGRLCAPQGRLLAMKGTRPDAELENLPAGFKVVGIYSLRVPGLDAERHLIHVAPESKVAGISATRTDGAIP